MTHSWCIRVPPFVTFILYLLLSVYSIYYVSSLQTNQSVHEIAKFEKMKMAREYLRQINKSAKKTIKVPPKMSSIFNSTYTFQLWNANGEKCPKGTIPIKRMSEDDILRTTRMERFRMKKNLFSNDDDDPNNHEYAVGQSGEGIWTQAKASLGIWNPHVDQSDEFSLSQIWVTAGTASNGLNSIEAGWHVYPEANGDSNTRFFIYWTNNNYILGYGCYNLKCPGFIQISRELTPGQILTRISTYDGARYDLTLSIERMVDGNWWLFWYPGDGRIEQVGYWPSNLFTHLRGPAQTLSFGGEITNKKRGGHTRTQMGSGHFANAGLGRTAYVSHIEMNGESRYPTLYNSHRYCYNTLFMNRVQFGSAFYYGGPGRGNNCP